MHCIPQNCNKVANLNLKIKGDHTLNSSRPCQKLMGFSLWLSKLASNIIWVDILRTHHSIEGSTTARGN